jgi:hypothetical protein
MAWLCERVRWTVFAPTIGGISTAACWVANVWTSTALGSAGLLSTALVLHFRLWDDVEDCERDAAWHPARVMVRAGRRVFMVPLLVLTAAAIAVAGVTGGPRTIAVIVAIDLATWAAYGLVRPAIPDAFWRYGVLLLKYPAFLLAGGVALGASDASRFWLAASATYAAAVTYEAVHTRAAIEENA